jgi:hypothetical protein
VRRHAAAAAAAAAALLGSLLLVSLCICFHCHRRLLLFVFWNQFVEVRESPNFFGLLLGVLFGSPSLNLPCFRLQSLKSLFIATGASPNIALNRRTLR